MGKYEVTFLQYDYYVWARRRSGNIKVQYPNDQGWGRYDRPAIDVSWNEAQAYVAWLKQKTGKAYRLPTEAQWEYAARAGTETAYGWGNTASKSNKANCLGCGSRWDGQQTAPVGSFDANPWKLHDTAGNVWEWVEDEFYPDRRELSQLRRVSRVLRGGSWYFNPQDARAAYRSLYDPGFRVSNFGFRVCSVFPIE